MATTKKPTKRPGAKTTRRLTDTQRRRLQSELRRLERKVASLKNATLTPDANKLLGRVVGQLRRASSAIAFV